MNFNYYCLIFMAKWLLVPVTWFQISFLMGNLSAFIIKICLWSLFFRLAFMSYFSSELPDFKVYLCWIFLCFHLIFDIFILTILQLKYLFEVLELLSFDNYWNPYQIVSLFMKILNINSLSPQALPLENLSSNPPNSKRSFLKIAVQKLNCLLL